MENSINYSNESISLHCKRYLTNLINFVAGDINEQDEDKQDQDQRADHDLNDIFVERQTECSVAVITAVAGSCITSLLVMMVVVKLVVLMMVVVMVLIVIVVMVVMVTVVMVTLVMVIVVMVVRLVVIVVLFVH